MPSVTLTKTHSALICLPFITTNDDVIPCIFVCFYWSVSKNKIKNLMNPLTDFIETLYVVFRTVKESHREEHEKEITDDKKAKSEESEGTKTKKRTKTAGYVSHPFEKVRCRQ